VLIEELESVRSEVNPVDPGRANVGIRMMSAPAILVVHDQVARLDCEIDAWVFEDVLAGSLLPGDQYQAVVSGNKIAVELALFESAV